MSELENIENVEQSSGEVSGEVTEPEDNSAEIEAEQERLRREHEEYLNSFPETTVFYRDLLVNGNVKSLGTVVRDPHIAEQWGFLDNHFDESELTYIGTPKCGTYYLKGYEKPEPTEEEKMKAYAKSIEAQVDAHLQELASSRGYDDVILPAHRISESCRFGKLTEMAIFVQFVIIIKAIDLLNRLRFFKRLFFLYNRYFTTYFTTYFTCSCFRRCRS